MIPTSTVPSRHTQAYNLIQACELCQTYPKFVSSPCRRSRAVRACWQRSSIKLNVSTYPNFWPGGSVFNGNASQSAVLVNTVLPHHVCMLFRPMVPLAGYSNLSKESQADEIRNMLGTAHVKKMMTLAMARPESNAADKTSVRTKNQISTRTTDFTRRTVVFRPPREVTAANDVVEYKSNDSPRNVIDGTSGWDGTCSREDDWEAKRASASLAPLSHNEVSYLTYLTNEFGHLKVMM